VNSAPRTSIAAIHIGSLLLALGSAIAAWWSVGRAIQAGLPGVGLIVGGAAHAIVASASASGLAPIVPDRRTAWRWRAACAAAFGSALVIATPLPRPWAIWYAAVAAIGILAGGLWTTSRDTSLWEDNFPPAPETAARVLAAHQARLGRLPAAPAGKRAFDVLLATLGGLAALPVAVIVCLAVWLEDPGPLFFVKNSVGRGGRNFRQWKIRTMVRSAEEGTGPVLASESDDRVLRTGRWLRRTALDELPQLLNILQGTMSFVGPRPQRTVLVDQYLASMPEYADRHRVAPGLAGLAQVAGHYYLTPRQKLRYDRLYVKHAGLGFDLKLIAIACAIVFWLRWNPRWDGRVPRAWIRWPKRRRS
jgi:lipopolysaccharide/colanic/teichoic acid biosynthesis glycosyltransferase